MKTFLIANAVMVGQRVMLLCASLVVLCVGNVRAQDDDGRLLLLARHRQSQFIRPEPAVALTPEIETPRRLRFPTEVELHDWKYLVVHHSASPSGSLESIHEMHLKRKDASGLPWKGIGYHFVIGNGQGMQDGEVRSTFRWQEQIAGAHAGSADYNRFGIGICLIGNFEQDKPTPRQMEALVSLIEELRDEFDIPGEHLVGHQDVRATACPGKQFPWNELKQQLSSR